MGVVGADAEQLRATAAQFSQAADRLQGSLKGLSSYVSNAGFWRGPDSERFRSDWNGQAVYSINAAVEALRNGAEVLRRNADEQEQASRADRGGASGGGSANSGATDPCQPAPTGAAELFARQSADDDGDGFHVEKVLCEDGTVRFIVYFEGLYGADRLNEDRTAKLLDGWVDPYLTAKLDKALAENPYAEIMLVGYSAGGIDAQNIAASGKYNVTNVVTYGSPVIQPDNPNIATAHLHADGDLVPLGGAATAAAQGPPVISLLNGDLTNNLAAQLPSSTNHVFVSDPNAGLWQEHSSAAYQNVAGDFDRSTDARFTDVKDSMKRFEGVAHTWGEE